MHQYTNYNNVNTTSATMTNKHFNGKSMRNGDNTNMIQGMDYIITL